jgi:hypothetical protein
MNIQKEKPQSFMSTSQKKYITCVFGIYKYTNGGFEAFCHLLRSRWMANPVLPAPRCGVQMKILCGDRGEL